jgi:hypothetical protein
MRWTRTILTAAVAMLAVALGAASASGSSAPPAPQITAPGDGAVLVKRATEIAGTAEAGAEVVVRDGDAELGRVTAGADGAWSLSVQLDRGEHVLTAEAIDAAGTTSARSAPVTVRVASATIAAVAFPGRRVHFELAASPTVPLTCRLVDPDGTAHEAGCDTSYDSADLAGGTYRFLVFPAGGDEALGDRREFNLAPAPPVALPRPAPAPLPVEVPAPVPAFRSTVVLRPLSGRVLVRRPGAASPLALAATEAVPLGATIDAKHGRVRLTAARRGTRPPQRAEFSGGVFVVTQKGAVVDLRLTGRRCTTRRLAGEGRGDFRISGRYATATARGTTWLVQDGCEGTRIRVEQGVVAVRDKVRHRTVLVHPRKPYLAKPRRL